MAVPIDYMDIRQIALLIVVMIFLVDLLASIYCSDL